jgi:hypothetical protein
MCGIGNSVLLCVIQFQLTQMQETLGQPEPFLAKYESQDRDLSDQANIWQVYPCQIN